MENNELCRPNPNCPVLDVDGFISDGKQFDIDIVLPEDNRNVIYGTIKNRYKDPIKDAVVKLVEIVIGKDGMKRRIPVTHTFTDENGEFVFGPLCPDKEYAISIWVNDVKHYKYTSICHRDGECLKGKPVQICGSIENKPCLPQPRN